MVDSLSRLAILHGTDKFGLHRYTPHYYDILQHLQTDSLKMLEIGVGGYGHHDRGGESLAMWRDFFPNAQITGIDIERKTMDLGPRVKIMQGSQVDADFLEAVIAERGPFDIILDDGSHLNEHVVETFDLLFPTLVPGGIYIVEDVQTAFFPRYGGSLELTAPNTVGFFGGMLREVLDGSRQDIVSIHRFHNMIILQKADPDAGAPGIAEDRRVIAANEAGQFTELAAQGGDDPARLHDALSGAGDGAVFCIKDVAADTALLEQLFAQVDHREILVHFPQAAIHPSASRILSLGVYPGAFLIEIGDNDFPSNFAYDAKQAKAAATLEAMGQAIRDKDATVTGILNYANLAQRFFGVEVAMEFVEELAARGSTDRRYYHLASGKRQRAGDWDAVVALNTEARAHHPLDPQINAMLGKGLRKLGRLDEAEECLRAAYKSHPRVNSLVVTLAQVLEAKGEIDEAISLHEKSIDLYKPPMRVAQLGVLVRFCEKHGRPENAVAAAKRLLELSPGDELAVQVIEKHRQAVGADGKAEG
ncbi:tetratricopeptide repeat protein [Paracoccus caeni]|uniref:Tetratricopeptide repeat protein n=1 Tax=Paracoccus caeni TaxID=657651 RepID=A0A934SHD7_9RHOB|nr:tetratricopeptide repeat protein [Paracoccus caeni]MBK4217106.1 tetratricopeptide repeat protein [Paracoccus caeni]